MPAIWCLLFAVLVFGCFLLAVAVSGGCWLLVVDRLMLDVGCQFLAVDCWLLVAGSCLLCVGWSLWFVGC